MTDETDLQAAKAAGDSRPGGAKVLGRLVARIGATRPGGMVPVPVPRPVATPERALAIAVGRAAEKTYRLAMRPSEVTVGRVDLAELPELLPERALIVIVEGPSEGLGVVALGPSLVASLIEVQTLGRLSARPVEDRRPTRTDAAICAEFINRLMSELGQELAAIGSFANVAGYRYASFIEDARPLPLLLEDGGYLRMRARLGIGLGNPREGVLEIVLPQGRREHPVPVETGAHDQPAPASPGTMFGEALRRNALAVPMQLDAVLCHLTLSLKTLRGLREGSTIPLPQDVLEKAWLCGPDGEVLFEGKLGEANGARALRVITSAAEEESLAAGNIFDETSEAWLESGDLDDAGSLFNDGEPPMDDLTDPDRFRGDDKDGAELPALRIDAG